MGSSVPFIIREVTNDKFRLVGEEYVHGLMDGEYIDMGLVMEEIDLI